jgi:hypothetical protein
MKMELRNLIRAGLLSFGLAALFTAAMGQDAEKDKAREARVRRATVQSELDYLRTSKVPISVELKQVTLKQAYDGIAGKAGIAIAYEGALNGGLKHDVSFKNKSLKEVLDKLGTTYRLTYRVDGPEKLTVIGRTNS